MAEWKVPISASLVLTMLLACLHRAYGYPSGAPSSACSSLTPGHMNSSSGQPIAPQTLQSPYVIKVQPTKYTPGQVITVTIESSIGFRGILLQARKGTTPVGTWQVAADYKHLNCNNSGDSLTHVNSSLKAGGTQFSWTAPSTLTGTVKIMATFALDREIFWTRQFASVADGAEQLSGGCATEPCVDGLCFQGANSYICDCNSGFEGGNCTDKIHSPYCQDGSLCGVGGTCFQQSNPVSSYRCVCETGYRGIECMTKVTCNDNPCINGGTCFNRHAGVGYFCSCPSDFIGTNCEVPGNVDCCFQLSSVVSPSAKCVFLKT
ncbi:neurocan core protein-like [Acanthaster planci]|uniref:Neurocan core protein-like n=1 Tax=Acanthaster planci TaxID=133434 RepID=A0A8B7Z876_ACAPL|nr:neurocan core protein-like [Acanthaster planci]